MALFAVIALSLAVVQWEKQFDNRGHSGTDLVTVGFFTDFVVLVVSIMGALAVMIKYYFE